MIRSLCIAATAALVAGCSTTQEVKLGRLTAPAAAPTTASLVSGAGNADMDAALRAALVARGIDVRLPVPAGTLRSNEVALLVTYADSWRWDAVMYLRSLTVFLYDGPSGSMLAMGSWENSPAHGYPDYRAVVNGLVDEMLAKIKALPKSTEAAQP